MLRLRDVLTTSASTLVSGGLGLLLVVLAARLLGPEQNGHFAQFTVILSLVSLGLNLGLGPATTYFVASGHATPAQVTRINLRFLAGASVCMGAVLVACHWWLDVASLEHFLRVPPDIAAMGVLGGLALLALNQAVAMRMGLHEYGRANLLNVLRTGLPIPLVVAAAVVRPEASWAAAAQSAALAGVALHAWARLRTGASSEALPAGLPGALIRFGGIAYFANLLHYIAIRGLILGLSYAATPAAVGFANIALLLVEALLLVPSALGQLLFPQSSQQSFRQQAMESVLRLSVLVALVAAVAVALLAPLVVAMLLGPAYSEVGTALRHLAPSIVLMTIPRILSPVLAGSGRPHVPLIGAALSVAIGVPLALWLMPGFGLVGTMWVVNAVSLCTAVVSVAGYSMANESGGFALLAPRRDELSGWWKALRRVLGRGRDTVD